MLRAYRRPWAWLVVALLALPGLVGLAAPRRLVSTEEARTLAPAPVWPRTLAGWTALPPQLNAYLQDHFGLRGAMVHAHALIGQLLLRTGTEEVLIGNAFTLFYRGDQTVQQSAGLTLRAQRIAATAALILRMRHAASQLGIRLVAGFPPNAATMETKLLPRWARNPGRPTEYDRLLATLRTAGVAAVDLRPFLHGRDDYLRHDTHWSPPGSLAGFDAMAEADGHPDWRLDPARVLAAPAPRPGGDLARMLGLEPDLAEPVRSLVLQDGKRQILGDFNGPVLDPGPIVEPSGGWGPSVLVIGDSFTADAFPLFLRLHARKVWWMSHMRCGFDWGWVARLHPNEIWWMPTERYALCLPGYEPRHLP